MNRLQPHADEIIAVEQAGFRAGRSATEQIFNLRILSAPGRPLQCRHRLQEGLILGLVCGFVGNHEEVQHQRQPCPSHQKTSMTRPPVQFSSIAAWETGSEQQLESDRDVYSHPPSSTYFWKGSCQTPYKITKALSPISALLMTSMA